MKGSANQIVTVFLAVGGFFGVVATSYTFGASGLEKRVAQMRTAETARADNAIESIKAQCSQQNTLINLELENLRLSTSESLRAKENMCASQSKNLRQSFDDEKKRRLLQHSKELDDVRRSATEIAEAKSARAQASQENQLKLFASLVAVFQRLDKENQLPEQYQSVVESASLIIPGALIEDAAKSLPPGVVREKTYSCIKNGEPVWLSANSSVESCLTRKTMMLVRFTGTSAVSISVDGVEYFTYPGKRRLFEDANCDVLFLGTRNSGKNTEAKLSLNCDQGG